MPHTTAHNYSGGLHATHHQHLPLPPSPPPPPSSTLHAMVVLKNPWSRIIRSLLATVHSTAFCHSY